MKVIAMTQVIKKDKRRETFDLGKIRRSIETAAKEAGLSDERIKKIVDEVSQVAIDVGKKKAEIETRALRETILKKLDELEPAVSKAWRKYDRTTKGGR